MKTQAAVLATFLASASAQNRNDFDKARGQNKVLIATGDWVDACKDASGTAVKDAKAALVANEGLTTASNAKLTDTGALGKAVLDTRKAMEEAVALTLEKDKALAALLAQDEKNELKLVGLKKAHVDAVKDQADKLAKKDKDAAYKAAQDKIYDTAVQAEKDASAAVIYQTAHLGAVKGVGAATGEELDLQNAKDAYLGANGDGKTAGKKAVYDAAKLAYDNAQAALAPLAKAYLAAKAISDPLQATLTAASATYVNTQAVVKVATDAYGDAGKGLVKAEADDLTKVTTTWTAYKDAAASFTTKGKATALAWSLYAAEKKLVGVAKNYTKKTTEKCEGGTAHTGGVVDKNVTECEALCTAKLPWTDGSATITSTTNSTMCYGFQWKANACSMFEGAQVTGQATGNGGHDCYIRNETTLMADFQTKKTASDTDWTNEWTAKVVNAASGVTWTNHLKTYLDAKSAAVFGKALETALKVDDATAKQAETDATNALSSKKSTTDTALVEADKKGYTAGKDYMATGKTQAQLKSAMDTAYGEYTPAKALYEAEEKEVADQKKMLVHAKKWETEAKAKAAGLKSAKETSNTGWDDVAKASLAAYGLAETATSDAQKAFAAYDAETKRKDDQKAVADDKTERKAVLDARKAAKTKKEALAAAVAAVAAEQVEIGKQMVAYKGLYKTWAEAVDKCEVAQYTAFRTKWNEAKEKKEKALKDIKALMAANKAARQKPGSGAAGARCEKPRSNGDRKSREKCDPKATPALCCGAATKNIDGVLWTIETCQVATLTDYSYQPPRAPMEVEMPKKQTWKFACIKGAQRVLTAAAATAAFALMMQ